MFATDQAIASSQTAALAAQTRFQRAVDGLEQALRVLATQAHGPAVTTEADKQALVTAHRPALRDFGLALEEFTDAGQALSPAELAQYHTHTHDRLHPLLLQSPFARRCFEKPLGYAGDYVMVRYILGDPFQGDSAFAQLVNFMLVQADVAQGHRNRINYLEALLNRHAMDAHAVGRTARGLTIGCGPAEETFRFIHHCPHAASLDLTLMDFNQETLDWTASRLAQACQETGRHPGLTYVHDSVYALARQKAASISPAYDVVICAGLFDYLTDRFCKRVVEFGARSLLEGGTLLVTNVSRCRSSLGMSEVLEWDLIYRSADHFASLLPDLEGFSRRVYVDETGTNVVAELRHH
ncbi:class I SAM-dependent methyltransferase [Burkholderia ubonensis]|uniref:class I SAM-dependent methyltransferase n=1 Tax=Burkholderia ubonensis TaxID=101571 RepID=UPI00075209D8|nr:class I SAM-dependent methyltransferase [Burkholderia ubonensis]KVP17283.1 hypothetical protein WJ84_03370 [Burkholderia ubonensis]